MSDLLNKHCAPCAAGTSPYTPEEAAAMLQKVTGWALNDDSTAISREFRFKNYYQTIAFVNALAWVAHSEDHHPDLEVHYNRCNVHFSTHSIGGLSENDFICAAKLDMLISGDS